RRDEQVKIRGYRIELGEIESVLQQVAGIQQAVVVIREEAQQHKQLVAYVMSSDRWDKEKALQYLRSRLPEYMVPSVIVALEELPLTANGKIDRRRLSEWDISADISSNYEAPRNETERSIAAIWQQLLGIDKVSIHDNFFERGGHSLMAMRVSAAIRKLLGREIQVRDIFLHPTLASLAALVVESKAVNAIPGISAVSRPEFIPLSFSQERLWFIDRLQGSLQYHIPAVFKLEGILDASSLEASFKEIIQRHEVLRTVINEQDGVGYQQVQPGNDWLMEQTTRASILLSGITLDEYIRGQVLRPFDLSADPMLRVILVEITATSHILITVIHHIAFDGWSISIMMKELSELYSSKVQNQTITLPALPVQYADYAIWQRKHLSGEVLANKLQYWKQQLQGVTPLELPTDYERVAEQSIRGAVVHHQIDKSIHEGLLTVSQQEGVTLFMTLLTAFKVLLHRYSEQTDICVGTPVASRQYQEIEGLIGFLINTVALRSEVDGAKTFHDLLQQIKNITLQAHEHQDVPFEKIIEAIEIERDRSRHPVFQVWFVMQNTPAAGPMPFGNLQIEEEPADQLTAQFEINLSIAEGEQGLELTAVYNADLFEGPTMQRLLEHYEQLLQAMVTDIEQPAGAAKLMTAEAAQQLLERFSYNGQVNKTAAPTTLVQLFEQQVQLCADAPALVFGEEQLSYHQLDARSNQIARYLQQQGVGRESLVGLCLDRSTALICSILGILKAGGAYVPLDPGYPKERLQYMINDCNCQLVITHSNYVHLLQDSNTIPICLDEQETVLSLLPDRKVDAAINTQSLAYVIYTSGSTGRPKGVMVAHGSVVQLINCQSAYFGIDNTDRILQFSNYSFDASVEQIFLALLNGAVLVLTGDRERLETDLLEAVLMREGITHLHATPGFLNSLRPAAYKLRRVIAGGDVCSREVVKSWSRYVDFYNEYGPTETTVTAIEYRHAQGDALPANKTLPIGRPLGGTAVYIVDKYENLCAVGVAGELYIGGAQVASGYLNHPELTAEKFIKDPFSKEPNARLYRTGDLARWLPDGNIEFLGRKDEQVKVRGYRIELGEIESILQQVTGVQQAVVVVHEDEQHNKQLAGYVVTDNNYDQEAALTALRSQLPAYMVPAILTPIAAIPLTTNGKVDRKKLSLQPISNITTQAYAAPRNELERSLAHIWQHLLGVDQIGIHDNFFELGGDSIIVIQVVSRVRKLGHTLRVNDLFLCQTIGRLSELILSQNNELEDTASEQSILRGDCGLLPIQQWFLQQGHSKTAHYNQEVLLQIDKSITGDELNDVFRQLAGHHDALRFTYTNANDGWHQQYGSYMPELRMYDLVDYEEQEAAEAIRRIGEEVQGSLNLEAGELIRPVLIRMPIWSKHNRLLIVVHHLAIDGVSWRILLEDLDMLITRKKTGLPADTVLKSSSCRQWHDALVQYGKSNRLLSQTDHWKKIQQVRSCLPVDTSYDGMVHKKDMRMHRISLNQEYTRQLLQDVPGAYRTEINDVLLSSLTRSLCNWSGAADILIGLEGHGREQINDSINLTRTLGWFTTQYPVWLQAPARDEEGDWLASVKEQLRKVPDKGLGYGVLKYINKTDALQNSEPWEIAFNYLGQLDNAISGEWLSSATEARGPSVHDDNFVHEKLIINCMVYKGELQIEWHYSSLHYLPSTVYQMAMDHITSLRQLIQHCIELPAGKKIGTPSDYGLQAAVTYTELQRFMEAEPRRQQIASLYPLSGLQQGMLFHGLYNKQVKAYIEQFACTFTGGMNPAVFKSTWAELCRRHSILRTGFYYDNFNIPVQCVFAHAAPDIKEIDFSNKSETAQQQAIADYELHDREQGFDFSQAPLMRISLLRLSDNRYRMIWTFHHILLDGWSTPVVMREFLEVYESLLAGLSAPAQREDRYEDYILYINRRDRFAEEAYWRDYLDGIEAATLLPFIHSTERTKGVGTHLAEPLRLDVRQTDAIQQYARQHRITVNTLMQGVWAYLLSRYTGKDEVMFGVVVSGRPEELPDIEERVGLYINTLPLRYTCTGNQSATTWLQQLQAQQVKSRKHQYAGLNDIQSWTDIRGDIFDSIMVFENYPVNKIIAEKKWSLQVQDTVFDERSNYPLNIVITENDEIDILFRYNAAVLDTYYAKQIRDQFQHILLQLVDGVANTGEIRLLDLSAEKELLERFSYNGPVNMVAASTTLVQLFEQQVQLCADAPALVFGEEQLSYHQLDARSNQIARYLQQQGVGSQSLVGLCLDRSTALICSILGILKAGGAYVPLDPGYPKERLQYMIDDCNCQLVITHSNYVHLLQDSHAIPICLDEQETVFSLLPDRKVDAAINTQSLAYVIYTSGSTGRPKGVMVPHGSVVQFINCQSAYFGIDNTDRILQFSNYSFDASVEQIFLALLNGAVLVLTGNRERLETALLEALLMQEGITHLHATPGFLNTLRPGAYNGLKRVISGGDVCSTELVRKWSAYVDFYNKYGPTETTVTAIEYRHAQGDALPANKTLPIGRPLSGTAVYIVDKYENLCAVGVTGELYIGGAQVTSGYLNQPTLTTARFTSDPFSNEPNARLYRTGDLARWLPDGNIEFLGRKDEQVKVRGYRIELGEIESILQQATGVQQAVVVVHEDEQHNKQLVGYIVTDDNYDQEAVITALRSQLPEYMVPAILTPIAAIPLTTNGKVDRKKLSQQEIIRTSSETYGAPENEIEHALATIWQDLLGVERVGIHDDFFELGGDSIIAIQVVSRARKQGYMLQVGDLFSHLTISKLYSVIAGYASAIAEVTTEQGILTGDSGLLPIQRRFLEQEHANASHYNQEILLQIDKSIIGEELNNAFRVLASHHDALRFSYSQTTAGYTQQYGGYMPELRMYDLAAETPEAAADAIAAMAEEVQRSLNITAGELIRAVLFRMPASCTHNRLLIVIHHLAVDGVSWRILLDNLEVLLTQMKEGKTPDLGVKSTSYRQWYEVLVEYSKGPRLLTQQPYWERLNNAVPQLPVDKTFTGVLRKKDMRTCRVTLNALHTRQLVQDVSRAYHTEINDLLLSALARTLCEWSAEKNILIGLEGHGRETIAHNIDLTRTIGWFTTVYPLLLQAPGKDLHDEWLINVKEQLRQTPDKGLGYGVLKYINKTPSLQGNDKWEILFNYLGQLDHVMRNTSWFSAATEGRGTGTDDDNVSFNKMAVNCMIYQGELIIEWSFSDCHYHHHTIQQLAAIYIQHLEQLIDHCVAVPPAESITTPSDHGLQMAVSYQELLRFMDEEENGLPRKTQIQALYPLSGLQKGLLFHGLYAEQMENYVEQFTCTVKSGLELELFKKTWGYLCRHHTILRTSFYYDAFNIPVQAVHRTVEVPVYEVDYRAAGTKEQEILVKKYEQLDHAQGFNFKQAPLMRISLLRLSDTTFHMIWTFHHILMDGWSTPVIMQEFLEVYEKLLKNAHIDVPAEDRYEDYIKYIAARDTFREEAYWRQYLHSGGPATLLPWISPGAERTKGIGRLGECRLVLNKEMRQRIASFVQGNRITINTLMQAVWAYLLYRYTGQPEITYGVIVAGRPEDLGAIEQRVGMYINTLPLRMRFNKDQSVKQWLQQLQAEQLESRRYQYSGLHEIQSYTGVRGDLFDTIMVFENYPVSGVLSSRKWALDVQSAQFHERTNYPLTVVITEGEGIEIQFKYNASLLQKQYILQIREQFEHILQQVISSTAVQIDDIRFLSPVQEQRLLEDFSHPRSLFAADTEGTVLQLIATAANKTPDAIAVVDSTTQLSYQQLQEQSNQLALFVQQQGVG
ncbi:MULTISPECIES: non-ribosomal peptide synthetase, partial [Niastella]